MNKAFFNRTSSLAVSSNGYYSLNHQAVGAYLSFINKEDRSETYLCSKPDCSHTNAEFPYFILESCDAYIGEAVLGSIVCFHNNIYVLAYDSETFEVWLVKISQEGSRHETLMTVGQMPSNGSYFRYVFADDNTIYMSYYDPEPAGKERTVSLVKIDLRTKERSSVYTYGGLDVSIDFL